MTMQDELEPMHDNVVCNFVDLSDDSNQLAVNRSLRPRRVQRVILSGLKLDSLSKGLVNQKGFIPMIHFSCI